MAFCHATTKTTVIMKRASLGEFEEVVLLWVTIQNEAAYGQSIAKAIAEEMTRLVTLSSVHTALYRLEEKGLEPSSPAEPAVQPEVATPEPTLVGSGSSADERAQ